MQLIRYNPMRDLQKMQQDFDKFWSADWSLLPATTTEAAPMDLYEEDGKMIAEINLPNFTKDEIKVSTNDGMLEVSAEHNEKEEDEGNRRYYMRESSNRYLRRVALPERVNTDQTSAEFKDGVLKITMPAKPDRESKEVAVK